eukprot:Gregarina_sp_Poly_1__1925@NODE_1503_length_3983_cov_26_528090_g936_i1_p2_GENE_NODE_1503_length_3983_cov_26_528090_g936_i1NODE_1503_length_3983_cov_26_528090_g936_i1_p2_ORF_typecomplete_len410_score50_82AGTRAP/PF06396_11/0_035DNA_repr_REX1B/PF14966_6/0_15DNA_repr_REX1B/PF14966_6/1e04DUF2096/PF09869_9/3_3e02DUF2096/PF09869_9/1_9Tup_N/PF08581_10/0_59Tup_N/PF08581_10/3_1e03_NODE_1503_length_3983_cov_26_528090_g936_i127543950
MAIIFEYGFQTGGNLISEFWIFHQRRDLKNRISSCYNELKQIENNVDHCEKQLKNIVSSTGGTSHVRFLSQLEEERLIVQVLCIEFASSGTVDLLAETENLYKITLNCNGQFSSSASRPRLENQVFFNEMHAFSLPKAEGIVELTLHSTLPASLGEETSEPIGNGVLSLGPLSDQLKHRMTVDFSGTHVEGTVVATLQWIKSKVSFYERHIHHYAIQRNAIFRDLQELQSKLDFLELSIFGNSARKQAMKKSNPFALVSTAIKQPDLIYSWAVNKVLVSVNASNFEKATQVVVGIALLFNCLTSFTRVLFLDSLAEGFTFWCNLEPSKRWNRSKYNKVTFCLLGSIAFDTVWLYYNVRIYRSPDSDLSHLTTVLSILNILVKFLLIVFLCHSRSRSHT